jgi:hypothetical protein
MPWLALLVAAFALWPVSARADLWDQMVEGTVTPGSVQTYSGAGQTGIIWRGPSSQLPQAGGGTVGSVQIGTGRGCGLADFGAEIRALFNEDALAGYFKSIAASAINSAPLVLLCYASPTLCDAYKHFKQMASGLLQARAAECQAVEQAAMGVGERMRKKQELACIEEKMQGGLTMTQALDACRGPDIKLVGYDLKPTDSLDVTGAVLDKVGASQETKDFARAILGDVRLRAGAGGGREIILVGPAQINTQWARTFETYSAAVDAALAEVAAGRTPTLQQIRQISVPGRPITVAELRHFALLDPPQREVAKQKLAAALTTARLTHQLDELKAELENGRQLASQTNQAQDVLEAQIRQLEHAIQRLKHLRENQDAIIDVVASIAGEARQKREETARDLLPTLPPKSAPATGPGPGGFGLGGGLVLPAR